MAKPAPANLPKVVSLNIGLGNGSGNTLLIKSHSSPLSKAVQVIADMTGVKYDIKEVKEEEVKSLGDKLPTGKFPTLLTPNGPLFESNAIARHFVRLAGNSKLLGANAIEEAQVNMWLDWPGSFMGTHGPNFFGAVFYGAPVP